MKQSVAQQLMREARWSLWLTVFYIIGWVGLGYFSPDGRGPLGFPIWFEFACIYLPIFFAIITFVVVKAVFKPVDLEGEDHE